MVKMRRSLLGYLPVESPIYKLHPMTRVLFLVIVSAYSMLIEAPEFNIIGIIFMLVLFKLGKLDTSIIKRYKIMFLNLLFMITIAYTFFGGYSPSYRVLAVLGPIRICWENIRWAFLVYIRLIFAILILIFFLNTSRERDIIVGLRALRVPFIICYVVGLSLRAMGLSLIDFQTIREAEKARALDLDSMPFTEKVKKFGLYIVPMIAIMLRRADEVSNALDSRGFKFVGVRGRRRVDYIMTHYRLGVWDYLIIGVMALIFFAILYLNIKYGFFSAKSSILYRI